MTPPPSPARADPLSMMAEASRGSPVDRIAWILSLWFGCGLVPRAPGTAGTLGAIPLYLFLRPYGLMPVAVAAGILTALGIWASSRVARSSGRKDPQFVCIDEVAGVFVTWLAAPFTWKGTIAGFLVFRLLDTTKPFPCRACEKLPGGFGIVLDDVMAGFWGILLLVAGRRLGWL